MSEINLTGLTELPELLRRLRAEIEATTDPLGTRHAALSLLGQLDEDARSDDPAGIKTPRLQGLFVGIESLLPPRVAGTELVDEIGKLLGLGH